MSVVREINGPTLEVSVLYDEYTMQIRARGEPLGMSVRHQMAILTDV
jgi:hypothetical protein